MITTEMIKEVKKAIRNLTPYIQYRNDPVSYIRDAYKRESWGDGYEFSNFETFARLSLEDIESRYCDNETSLSIIIEPRGKFHLVMHSVRYESETVELEF